LAEYYRAAIIAIVSQPLLHKLPHDSLAAVAAISSNDVAAVAVAAAVDAVDAAAVAAAAAAAEVAEVDAEADATVGPHMFKSVLFIVFR
jgi:hypothetical protein